MSEHVWVSNAQTRSEMMYAIDNDVIARDEDLAIQASRALKQGEPVAPENCPTKIWAAQDVDFDEVGDRPPSDLFFARTHWIVSARAAEILRQFDLGEGGVYPISQGFYHRDLTTKVPGEFFTWVFGNRKSAFLAAESRDRPSRFQKVEARTQDDDVAVSRAALSGPDVWVDPLLFKSIFLSGPLGDALGAAGLRESMALLRCRVI